MKALQILTLGSIMIFLLWGCIRKECREFKHVDYSFHLPVNMSPALSQEPFSVGDTIVITSRFCHDVLDVNSNQISTLENYDFTPFVRMGIIDTIPLIDGFQNIQLLEIDAEEHVLTPTLSSGWSLLNYKYRYKNKEYSFSFKFIPQTKGVYFLGFASGLFLERPDVQDFPGKCKDRRVDVNFFMNGGADNNFSTFSLYQNNNDFLGKFSEDDYKQSGGVTFEVQ